jgi:hypothetical protein
MFYKKWFYFLVVILTLIGLSACKPTPSEATIIETPTPTEETPIPTGSVLIQFVTNNDTTVPDLVIESGQTVESFVAPTVTNQLFVAIYTDQALTELYDVKAPITANKTLYLRYAANDNATIVNLDIEFLGILYNGMELEGERFTYPTSGKFGSSISWTSLNNTILTTRGYLIAPSVLDGTQDASVRARVSRGTSTKDTIITFRVLPHVPLTTVTSYLDLPFTNMTSEYDVADTLMRAYYLNTLAIPYVDIKDFLMSLSGLIETDELEFVHDGDLLTISYIVEYTEEDEFGIEQPKFEEYSLVIDFNLKTISVETLSFFSGYIKSTATDYSEGLTYLDTYYEDGETVIFNLNKYRIDILQYDENGETKFLLPFHLANQLFVGSTYYNVYYNGDGFFGIYGVPSSSTTATPESQAAYNAIRNSTLNETTIHYEVSLQTFHMLAFVMDYYYGLKKDRGIDEFYPVLERYANNLVSGSTRRTSDALFEFLNKTLDDLHTSHRFTGMYEPASFNIALTNINQVGNKVRDWYYILWDVQDIIAARYGVGQNPPDYRFIDDGKTAVIYLDGFYTATVDDPDGDDSNRFMREVMDAIMLENPNVENIIVDLSYNTGGNLGALLRVMGYLTEQPIEMHYQNPTSGSNVTYFTEVATDAYENINWFILTSRVTFSAANLMTSIAKQQGIATIIGTTSGGGASSITPVILPNGTFFTMSSLNVLSYRVGSDLEGWTYFSIENGIEPDYIVSINDLHKDNVLADIVNQANADKAN